MDTGQVRGRWWTQPINDGQRGKAHRQTGVPNEEQQGQENRWPATGAGKAGWPATRKCLGWGTRVVSHQEVSGTPWFSHYKFCILDTRRSSTVAWLAPCWLRKLSRVLNWRPDARIWNREKGGL